MPLETLLSDADLDQIVCRATNLTERLAGDLIPTGEGQPAAAERLARWKHFAANGDETAFRRVLASHGLPDVSETQLLGMLGNVRPAADPAPPSWARLLQEITRAVAAAFPVGNISSPLLSRPVTRGIPFASLYVPIAVLARQKVQALVPSQTGWMHVEAWHGLQRHLLSRISAICSLALQPKFLAFKAVHQSGPAFAFFAGAPPARTPNPPGSPFRAFVREQGAEGLRGFFLEYPVAARLTAQVTSSWIEFVAEFLDRLEADAAAISERFRAAEPLGKIVAIRAGLSDPHHAGRSVLMVDFAKNCRLLYKPRPLQIDAAFFDLCAAFNVRLRLGTPPRPDTLARPDYGWQTYVAPAPCPSRREARRFYRRAGALLGLIHEMRGMDFHCENLIAAGGHPVPVDLEALFHPPLPETVSPKNTDGGKPLPDSSILRTGLLPVREHGPGTNRFPDYSALGAPMRQSSATAEVRWKYVNSARMTAFWGKSRYTCVTHLPRLHGRLLSARRHVPELLDGIDKAARFLRSRRPSARELHAMIADMLRLTTRQIRRPTWLYLALMHSSLRPHLLTAGVDRSIALEALPDAAVESVVRRAEIAALETLDVPHFRRESADAGRLAARTDWTSEAAAVRASLRGSSSRRRVPRV